MRNFPIPQSEHIPPCLAAHLSLHYPPVPCGVDLTYVGSIRTEGVGLPCPFSACSMEHRRLVWICCSCVLVTLNCCKHSCTWEEEAK